MTSWAADLGEGGRTFFSFQGFDPLPTQRVPLWTILRYPILADGPIWRQFILILRGSARQKNAIFWSKFSKCAKKRLFRPAFSKLCLRRRNFGQNRVFLSLCSALGLGRAREINLVDLKKIRPLPSRKS